MAGFQRDQDLNTEGRRLLVPEHEQYEVLIGTLGVCGLGLTLTQAHQMVLMEPQYVAADEEQAIARIFRVGQTQDCTCWRLTCTGPDGVWGEKRVMQRLSLRSLVHPSSKPRAVSNNPSSPSHDHGVGDTTAPVTSPNKSTKIYEPISFSQEAHEVALDEKIIGNMNEAIVITLKRGFTWAMSDVLRLFSLVSTDPQSWILMIALAMWYVRA